ncbi:nucleotide exchange factor SIL1-like [Tubulanus polymorphus]|uniref:nucleotide exchange factor SIL1-like n=1 Tax=Tubulanus polymorphus TaxID=672921 RepID=UPI003DA46F35
MERLQSKYFKLMLALLFILMSNCLPESTEEKIDENESKHDGALVAVETEEDEGKLDPGDNSEDVLTGEVFYPTHDWQTVKPGQAIPQGLHVRMNLETGLKEAKLMEGDDGMKYWKKGDKKGMVNTDSKSFTINELKKALKDFKADSDDVQDENIKNEALKKSFRSYDELKQDFKQMKLNVKTDNEIINELMAQYQSANINVDDKLTILEDLEYHLHQIDNAQDFVKMGGLELLMKDLNNTDESVRSHVALVLGSSMQNNPRVQISALQTGLLQHLIRMLATEKSVKLRSKILYALSSLVRQFPFAQKKMLELGGVHVLVALFKERNIEKLQLKGVILISDLLEEKHSLLENRNKNHEERIKQYSEVLLLEALIDQNWCDLFPNLLNIPEHDSREKVLNAMSTLVKPCRNKFNKVLPSLTRLRTEYENLAAQDQDQDSYYTDVYETVNNVINRLAEKDEL